MRRALFLALLVVSFLVVNNSHVFASREEGAAPTGREIGQGADSEALPPDSSGFCRSPDSEASEEATDQGAESVDPSEQKAVTEEEERVLEAVRKSLTSSNVSDGFDIPIVLNDAVDLYIKYFTGPGRKIFARWLDRAKRYEPTIRAILKKNGLPEDLVYVAMIESGFNMKANSPAKAKGPWQFIHETGQRYGLKVDFWVDERCNVEKSTVAAARYFKELFDRFGCWYLAAAGYNAGERRVEKAIAQTDTKDFWKLREYKTLPKETQEYVPQLIAAALIAKDPEKYGFSDGARPPVYRLMKIGVPGGIPLKRIAGALSVDTGEVKALNPEIMRGVTPANRKQYQLTLPGTGDPDQVREKLDAELQNDRKVVGVVPYRVKKTNCLAGIMKRFRVSRSDLMLLNEGGERPRLARGQVLYIPQFSGGNSDASSREGIAADVKTSKYASSRDDDNEVITLKSGKRHHGVPEARPALVRHVVYKADRHSSHKARAGGGHSSSARARRTHGR